MTIAYDAKRITNNATGLGNYSRFVLETLTEFRPENRYLLYSPSAGDPALYKRLLTHRSVHIVRWLYLGVAYGATILCLVSSLSSTWISTMDSVMSSLSVSTVLGVSGR